MKNKKQTILIILISVLIILGITAFVLATTINKTKANTGTGEEETNAQQTIQFNDKNLYNAIKRCFDENNIEYTSDDINTTLTMTQENINNIGGLGLQENDISDLTGLEKFIKLTKLELADNNIENITILSDLKELESLGLKNNKITNIDSLSNLEKITWLNISYNGIEDIEVLSNLKKLKELHMEKNPISDISALEKLPLEWLSADNCKIEDISPLNTNLSLETTSFFNQKISKTITSGREIALPQILIDAKNPESKAYVGSGKDYQLTNCTISSDGKKVIVNDGETTAKVTIGGTTGAYGTTLEIKAKSDTIDISFNDINLYNAIKEQLHSKNIEYTANDTNKTLTMTQENINKVEILELINEEITDITGLETFKNLKTLDLDQNQITDINAISGLTNLQTLYLNDNQISDISALSGLTNLQTLGLLDNQISDIDAISGLTNLQWLNLCGNQISDIDAISGLTNLKTLSLGENHKISDIGAISSLTNLQTLYLLYNQISDISALSGLTNLQKLYLQYNQISDISALSGLTNLQTLDLNKNNIEDITPINNISSLQYCTVDNQTINKTITSGKEIALPQILIDAKNSSSIAYVGSGIDYQLTNCTISSDGKKVIVNGGETTAKVTIGGTTGAYGTVLEIDVTSPILTVTYDPPQKPAESVVVTIKSSKDIDTTKIDKSWTVVDSKTIQKTYIENVQEEITIYDLAGNSNKITIKITNICKHIGSYTIKYNETEHWEECTKCGAEKPGSRQSHTYGVATSNGNGTHTKKCTVCSYSKTENCNYINGKCSECGATKPNTGCVHNYITQYNETEHWEYCTKCKTELEGSRKKHTFGTPTSNGNGTHTKKCTSCPYSKTEDCTYVNGKCSECGANKPDTECTHNYEIKYNEIEHWEECTKCGAEKSGSRQNHTYGTATGNGNGTHSRKCIVCPHIKTEKCNCSIGGLCSICGDKEYIEDCEHSYEIKYNETEHWEECTKCGAEKPESRETHTYGVATSNGNGTHTKKCKGCSYLKTENCTYINGKCSECGATKPDNENPGDGQDNTNNGQNNGNTNNGNSNNGNSNNGNSGGKPLPQTGTSSIVIIGIIAFTVLGTLTFIRIKKYKLN